MSHRLFDFTWITDFEGCVNSLKALAMPEDWDYRLSPTGKNPILVNYIHHTFSKVHSESKIEYSNCGDYCTFNIGLVTVNQEELFGYLQKNKNPRAKSTWFFKGWRKESDRDLEIFSKLPDIPNYFSDSSDLIYDTKKALRINIDHIIRDNLVRFPDTIKVLDEHLVRNILSGTIEDAKKRIRRNYKTAIPQYYEGKLQLLIPLCLQSKSKADLALVIEKGAEDTYRASTCLTLDMAMNNARLIAKPDDEWLKA